MTRRDFLRAGSLCGLTLALPAFLKSPSPASIRHSRPYAKGDKKSKKEFSCITLRLLGAPSHLDTWDMKPDAPSEFRGPFKPIKTNVAGIEISEIFPRMAQHADMFSIVRSVHYPEEMLAGLSFAHLPEMQAGYCLYGQEMDWHESLPLQAQDAFDVGSETNAVREKYGRSRFGQSCLLARRLVERGVRFVTVNMCSSVLGESTWDCHGSAPFPTLNAYRTHCGPWFDNGYTSLITELKARGLYDTTIVIAAGEFGRTPRLNRAGGRDHWPHCWSVILGGGGLQGGQIIGASDSIGAYPTDYPITPADLTATLYAAMGLEETTLEGITLQDRTIDKDKNPEIASDSPAASVLKNIGSPISTLL